MRRKYIAALGTKDSLFKGIYDALVQESIKDDPIAQKLAGDPSRTYAHFVARKENGEASFGAARFKNKSEHEYLVFVEFGEHNEATFKGEHIRALTEEEFQEIIKERGINLISESPVHAMHLM